MPKGPWQHIRMDFYGPTHWKEMVLVFVELYSRFPFVRYVGNTSASAAVRALDTVLGEFGNVCRIDTDNGPPFTS